MSLPKDLTDIARRVVDGDPEALRALVRGAVRHGFVEAGQSFSYVLRRKSGDEEGFFYSACSGLPYWDQWIRDLGRASFYATEYKADQALKRLDRKIRRRHPHRDLSTIGGAEILPVSLILF